MELDAYLAAHHRVVDAVTLRRLGYTDRFADARVAAGRWQRVYRGVLCAYSGPLTFESRCRAALCLAGPYAALDGATAGKLHGLAGADPVKLEVVVPHRRQVSSPAGVVVRRSRTLAAADLRVRRGLAVVTVERAVLRVGPDAVVAAVQQGLTTPDRLRECLRRLGRVPGRLALATAVDDAGGGSRSCLERRFSALLRTAGLPPPVQDHPVVAGGRRFRLDACYPDRRIAIELDGRAYHLMSEVWEDDLARQNVLVLAGWLLLRFTARDLRERPAEVVEAVRRAWEARGVAEC